MTIYGFTSKQLLERNPQTGKFDYIGDASVPLVRACTEFGENGERLHELHAQVRGVLSSPSVLTGKASTMAQWFIQDACVQHDLALCYENLPIDVSDATSGYRTVTQNATSWADLYEGAIYYGASGYRRSSLVATLFIQIDDTRRNVQRLFTQFLRMVERDMEALQKDAEADGTPLEAKVVRECRNAARMHYLKDFDFEGKNLSEQTKAVEASLPALTEAQERIQFHFDDFSRPLSALVSDADIACPYTANGCGEWFADTRLRESVFIMFFLRVLMDPECAHRIFSNFNWSLNEMPAIVFGAVRGVPQFPGESRVLVVAYPKGVRAPTSRQPTDARPVWRSVDPARMVSAPFLQKRCNDPNHPEDVFRKCVEADMDVVTTAFILSRFHNVPVFVESFDADVFLIMLLAVELFRLFPETDIHYYRPGRPGFSPPRFVQNRRVAAMPIVRRPPQPADVAPIYWLRNSCKVVTEGKRPGPQGRYTIVDIFSAYSHLYHYNKDRSVFRHSRDPALAARVRGAQLYEGELEATREMPALVAAFAACGANDYTMVLFKGASPVFGERMDAIMDAGVGYMRCPHDTRYLMPYCRSGYIRETSHLGHDAMAFGMSHHCIAYFLSFCHLMWPATSMDVSWVLATPDGNTSLIRDVFQYRHWASTEEIREGSSVHMKAADPDDPAQCEAFRNSQQLWMCDHIFGQNAVRFGTVETFDELKRLMAAKEPEGTSLLDRIDYMVAPLRAPLVIHPDGFANARTGAALLRPVDEAGGVAKMRRVSAAAELAGLLG
jgi:hypothetical protein